jgi:hypothetical protein
VNKPYGGAAPKIHRRFIAARHYVSVVGRRIGRKDERKVAWLTVREAAERLEISEAAVRKRMQRGTLDHEKWPDGRVYVSLDALKGVDGEDRRTSESDSTNETRRRLLQLSDIASLVAVVSVSTYIVGLFTFWYPISMTYTGDFATA